MVIVREIVTGLPKMILKRRIRPHTPFLNKTATLEGIPSFQCLLFLIVFVCIPIFSAAPSKNLGYVYGYKDVDQNGINDLYFDKNGDGINDLTGDTIVKIEFIDEDKDGVNDLFSDEDGDGINDKFIYSKYMPVIDRDSNFVNDITGHGYKKGFYDGYSFGKVVEEMGIIIDDFVDTDGDFVDDRIGKSMKDFKQSDRFIDEDGDGINDERQKSFMPDIEYRKVKPNVPKKGKR